MLTYKIEEPAALDEQQIEQAFQLMQAHYNNVIKDHFIKDLMEKTGIIALYSNDQQLAGFSTYQIYFDADLSSWIIFSGDTIIKPNYWGSSSLFYAFGSILRMMLDRHPLQNIYWFLISKGIRTYCMLPLFFQDYFPKVDDPIPHKLKPLLDQIAANKFGKNYDPARGVIMLDKDYLCSNLSEVSDKKSKNKHVQFFMNQNPGFHQGHELACLTKITLDNILPHAKRYVTPLSNTVATPIS